MDIPPIRALSSTMLKLALHMGQLLARSTHGFRHSLCRLWPHGRRCATNTSSFGLDSAGSEAVFWTWLG